LRQGETHVTRAGGKIFERIIETSSNLRSHVDHLENTHGHALAICDDEPS